MVSGGGEGWGGVGVVGGGGGVGVCGGGGGGWSVGGLRHVTHKCVFMYPHTAGSWLP